MDEVRCRLEGTIFHAYGRGGVVRRAAGPSHEGKDGWVSYRKVQYMLVPRQFSSHDCTASIAGRPNELSWKNTPPRVP